LVVVYSTPRKDFRLRVIGSRMEVFPPAQQELKLSRS